MVRKLHERMLIKKIRDGTHGSICEERRRFKSAENVRISYLQWFECARSTYRRRMTCSGCCRNRMIELTDVRCGMYLSIWCVGRSLSETQESER